MNRINLKRLINRKEVSSIIDDFAALSAMPLALLDANANPIRGGAALGCTRRYPVELNGEVLGWVAGDEKVSVLASLISFAAAKESEEKALSSETLQRYRELLNLFDFSERIVLSLDSEDIARSAIEQAVKSIHATGASLVLGDARHDVLRIAAAYGDACPCEPPLDSTAGIAGALMKRGNAEIINDLSSDPRFIKGGGEVHAMMCAPLICKDSTLGILTVGSREPHVYRAEDLRLLKSIASQTASALANAQFFEQLQANALALEKKNLELEAEIIQHRESEKALRESEEKYRLHFENVTDVVYSVDRSLRIGSISPSVEQIMGYTQEELTCKPFSELTILTEESLARAISDTQRIFNGETVPCTEYEMIAKDGSHRFAEIRNKAVYRGESVGAIISVARDITDQKKVQRALAESEMRFRTMADSITNGLIIMEGGKTVYINDRACAICGYPREELMNIWGPDLAIPEDSMRTEELLKAFRSTGVFPEHVDTWIRRKDGSKCCLNLRFSFSYKEQQQYAGYVVITDITDEVLAREQLQAAKSFIDNVIESSLDAIIVTDTKGYINRVNRYFLELLGYTHQEVLGKHISEFSVFEAGSYEMVSGAARSLDEAYVASQRDMFLQLRENKKVLNWEVYLINRKRQVIPTELNISYLYDNRGERTGAVGILRDITERQKSHDVLQETLAFVDNIIESSLDAIVVSDAKGFLNRVNRAFCRLTGFKPEDVYGKRMPELSVVMEGTYESTAGDTISIDAQYLDYTQAMVSRFVSEGSIAGWESYLFRNDGKVIPVDVNIVYLFDKQGSRAGTVGILRDSTERKRSEKEVMETRDFADNIIESSLDPIVVADAMGYITRVNKSFQKLLGYDVLELLGRHVGEFIPPQPGIYDSRSGEKIAIEESYYRASEELMVKLAEEGSLSRSESCYMDKQGMIVPVEQTIFYLYDKRGERIAVVGISRDITERKMAERQILEAKNFLDDIIKTSADGILVTDATSTITMVNKAAELVLGYSRDELLGRKTEEFIPKGGEVERRGKMIQKELYARGAVYQYEHRWMKKSGELIDVEMSIGLLRDPRGEVTGSVVCIRDVSERKAAERKLLDYQHQLRCLTSQLTLTEEQERRRIATDLHDSIGQSLALSKIKLGVLGASITSPDLARDLAEIRSLLDQTIQDTRSLMLDLCPPFLYELGLEKALEWLLEDMEKRYDIRIQFEWDAQSKSLYDDDIRILLYQSVRELLINVVKHAQAKTAKVFLRCDGQHLLASVEDDGKGFIPGPRGLRVGKEGGFGLFRIQERFQHLGGAMKVESRLRQGTKVCLEIPMGRNVPGKEEVL